MVKALYTVFDNNDNVLCTINSQYDSYGEAMVDLNTTYHLAINNSNAKIIEYSNTRLKFIEKTSFGDETHILMLV